MSDINDVQDNLGSFMNATHQRFSSLNEKRWCSLLDGNHENIDILAERLTATQANSKIVQQMLVNQSYLANI